MSKRANEARRQLRRHSLEREVTRGQPERLPRLLGGSKGSPLVRNKFVLLRGATKGCLGFSPYSLASLQVVLTRRGSRLLLLLGKNDAANGLGARADWWQTEKHSNMVPVMVPADQSIWGFWSFIQGRQITTGFVVGGGITWLYGFTVITRGG